MLSPLLLRNKLGLEKSFYTSEDSDYIGSQVEWKNIWDIDVKLIEDF